MAVLFTSVSLPTSKTIGGATTTRASPEQIAPVFGKPAEEVNIYTGAITFVGANHIEYDMNSFIGCAGAAVFLLDQDQPDSVKHCDHDNAIAIHAEAHPVLTIDTWVSCFFPMLCSKCLV
jgi:hypothetical protein